MKNWQIALDKQFKEQSKGDFEADYGSMTLLTETSRYWLIRYDEGQAEFINLVYKDGTDMETLEVK